MISLSNPNWLLVASDFVSTGGMDIANLALAQYLADECKPNERVELVTHRVEETLLNNPHVCWTKVSRPLGMNLLGEVLLNHVGRRSSKHALNTVVNGGNCTVPNSINWVHYVHAAYKPKVQTGLLRRIKTGYHRWRSIRWERRSLNASRLIICNSQLTADHVVKLIGCSPDKVRVVYYGINSSKFFPLGYEAKLRAKAELGWDDGYKRVMFIGALADDRKGFQTVFDAWKILCRDSNWNVKLMVVGSGAAVPLWKEHTTNAGFSNSIEFLGFRNDVPELLKAADALVAPTLYEAYGLGVHEALCCGLPAIVTKETGIGERYPSELNSLLLGDPRDAERLAEKLRNWNNKKLYLEEDLVKFSDQLRSKTWSEMAREFIEHCH